MKILSPITLDLVLVGTTRNKFQKFGVCLLWRAVVPADLFQALFLAVDLFRSRLVRSFVCDASRGGPAGIRSLFDAVMDGWIVCHLSWISRNPVVSELPLWSVRDAVAGGSVGRSL